MERQGEACISARSRVTKLVGDALSSSTLAFAEAKEHRRKKDKAERAISIGQLSRLPCVHFRPINVVVFDGP